MRKIRRPSDAIIIALEEAGMRSRSRRVNGFTQFADFGVTGIYRHGERFGTLAVVYQRHAVAKIVEHANDIERRTRELGYPFHVKTWTYVSKTRGNVVTHVEIANV